MAKSLIIAAPRSGSGKTLFTLGLLRALRMTGLNIASAKLGPDYIDPRFHTLASGRACLNLDLWAMGRSTCQGLLQTLAAGADAVIIEGVMGLFDGPEQGEGSTADTALALQLPVLLVVDCEGQSGSVAALVHGFKTFKPDVNIIGVILNRVASPRHGAMLKQALADLHIPVLGLLMRQQHLHWPSRHLGLVEAENDQPTEDFIASAALAVEAGCDIARIVSLGLKVTGQKPPVTLLPPPGQRIAIARDQAFSFMYPALIEGWAQAGCEISFFSPLADEAAPPADCVILPGGYPELHAGRISAATNFLTSLRASKALVYGECGGFMVLGEEMTDATGRVHPMAGLLPVRTSFAKSKLHLGYRDITLLDGPLLDVWPQHLRGHEFHYSTLTACGVGLPLFTSRDASGRDLGSTGLRRGNVMGSYIHIIAGHIIAGHESGRHGR